MKSAWNLTAGIEQRREGASTCSLAISTMTNKLNYWLLAALISNASTSTSSSKGAHDDPPFIIRDLLTLTEAPPSITGHLGLPHWLDGELTAMSLHPAAAGSVL